VLKDKACFIGLTAAGASDLRPMPLDNIYPMVGLQASVFNSVVTGKFITDAGAPLNTLINLFVFILALVICLRLSPLKAFLGSIITIAVYFASAAGLFIIFNFWVDLFFPLLIVALTYIGVTAERFFQERKKRQLLEKELDIARSIQKSFLPSEIKELCGVKISAFMQPAKFVAGDLYDIVAVGAKRMGVFIGDVSGKGVPASLIMAQTISLFRIFSRTHPEAAQVLGALNKEFYGKFQGRFVTCLYIVIDPQGSIAEVASAGHAPVLVYRKSNNALTEIELSAKMPLGIMEDLEYNAVSFEVKAGDKIIVFTDGLTEARDREGREFGLENIRNTISKHAHASAQNLADSLKEEVAKFAKGAEQHDDITLIVLEVE